MDSTLKNLAKACILKDNSSLEFLGLNAKKES